MTTTKRSGVGAGDVTAAWGDQVALLYGAHFDDLCRTAQRLLDTRHAAEEAVQEAFVRLTTLDRRPMPGSELPYLRSMVLNEARSTLRHRGVVRRTQSRALREPERDLVCEAVFSGEQVRRVRAAVRTLPLRQRQVVSLRHLAGLSERETAEVLAISRGSVKTHASRGLSAMRSRIGDVA